MNSIFNELLISSPNGEGGLVFIKDDKPYLLDNKGLAGLFVSQNKLLKAIQPDLLEVYKGTDQRVIKDEWVDDIHDVLEHDNYYYVVGTMKNVVIKFNHELNIVDKWVFNGELDSIHINCLAILGDQVIYSAFGEFTKHRGYKGNTVKAGYIAYLETGDKIIEHLSQPHSIFSFGNNILVANSQEKELREYSVGGELIRKIELGGYTRGLCIDKKNIYIGLSCSRNSKIDSMSSASVVAISKNDWTEVGRINLPTKEIYSIVKVENKEFIVDILLHHVSGLNDENKKLVNQKLCADNENQVLEQSILQRNKEVNILSSELSLIKKSLSWKFLSYMRIIKNKIIIKIGK